MTFGTDQTTGAAISGDDYDAQLIADLLTTPLTTYLMRPEYGWVGFEILDQPVNKATALLLTSAAAMAMRRWLPSITVASVSLSGDFASGSAVLTVERQRSGTSNSVTSQTIPLSG